MRGRAALGLAASLLLHGGILLWTAGLEAPPPRAVVELEVVRIEPRPAPGEDGEGGPPPAAPAEPPVAAERRAGKAPSPAARPDARARAPAPEKEAPREDPPPLEAGLAEDGATQSPEGEEEEAEVHALGGEAEASSAEPAGPLAAGGGEGEGSAGEGPGGGGEGAGEGSGAGSGSGRGSGPGEDPHAALLAHLRAHAKRCYPAPARRRGIQGVVGLSFCIDESGMPERMRIERSSGSALLDEAARSCVIEGAAPLPGPVGCVVLDLPFRLR